jgi:hypothetical protein
MMAVATLQDCRIAGLQKGLQEGTTEGPRSYFLQSCNPAILQLS